MIREIRENIPRSKITFSGETISFSLVTQKEIDAVTINYNTGFTKETNYKPQNSSVGIASLSCYSLTYQETPSITIYKNNQKIILLANRHEEAINQYCKEH